jgi:hypothetical protein
MGGLSPCGEDGKGFHGISEKATCEVDITYYIKSAGGCGRLVDSE